MSILSRFGFLSFPLAALALLLALTRPASAQILLTFDESALGNPSYNANNIYVTFAASSADMAIGSTPVNFANSTITVGNISYGTSPAFSLASIASAGGLTINVTSSLSAWISYGDSNGISLLPSGSQPNYNSSSTTRYSQFEITYSGPGNHGDKDDITNISQYGGNLKMTTYTGGVVSNATLQESVSNTGTAGDIFRALAAVSGNNPSAVFTSGGSFQRIVGPQAFANQAPYPTFNNYLGSLYTNTGNGTASAVSIQNLVPGAALGGQGSIGMASISGNFYNADYNFGAFVSQSSGNYAVTLSGNVIFVANTAVSPGASNITFSNLSITIAADNASLSSMSNFIFQESNNANTSMTFSSGWSDIDSDFSGGNSTINQKVFGDFAQAMLTGMVGSNTTISGTSTVVQNLTVNGTIGSLPTSAMFGFPDSAYDVAQPDNPFYNQYSAILSSNSTSFGTNFSGNGTYDQLSTYANPYDDRYGIVQITTDAATTNMVISLLPDGNVAVPEPATTGLVTAGVGCATAFIALRYRRRQSQQ